MNIKLESLIKEVSRMIHLSRWMHFSSLWRHTTVEMQLSLYQWAVSENANGNGYNREADFVFSLVIIISARGN